MYMVDQKNVRKTRREKIYNSEAKSMYSLFSCPVKGIWRFCVLIARHVLKIYSERISFHQMAKYKLKSSILTGLPAIRNLPIY